MVAKEEKPKVDFKALETITRKVLGHQPSKKGKANPPSTPRK